MELDLLEWPLYLFIYWPAKLAAACASLFVILSWLLAIVHRLYPPPLGAAGAPDVLSENPLKLE